MSTTIITETIKPSTTTTTTQPQIEFARCECCGLTEEYTLQYIQKIRERYTGKWVCGLCSEAVNDQVVRSKRLISTEEALNRHMIVCNNFRSSPSPPAGGAAALIAAVRGVLRRSRNGGLRSMPVSPTRDGGSMSGASVALARSESCFPDLSG